MQEKHRRFLSDMLKSMLLTALLVTVGRYFLHGVPLIGLPKAEDVQSVTVIGENGEHRVITDAEDVDLLVTAANMLNYRFGTPEEQQAKLTVIYELTDGGNCVLQAGETTVWWKGKAHPLKQKRIFYNVAEGLFFFDGDQTETEG